jgi:hypothetical protein
MALTQHWHRTAPNPSFLVFGHDRHQYCTVLTRSQYHTSSNNQHLLLFMFSMISYPWRKDQVRYQVRSSLVSSFCTVCLFDYSSVVRKVVCTCTVFRDIPLGIPLLIRRTVNVKAMVKPWKAQSLDYGIKESYWSK